MLAKKISEILEEFYAIEEEQISKYQAIAYLERAMRECYAEVSLQMHNRMIATTDTENTDDNYADISYGNDNNIHTDNDDLDNVESENVSSDDMTHTTGFKADNSDGQKDKPDDNLEINLDDNPSSVTSMSAVVGKSKSLEDQIDVIMNDKSISFVVRVAMVKSLTKVENNQAKTEPTNSTPVVDISEQPVFKPKNMSTSDPAPKQDISFTNKDGDTEIALNNMPNEELLYSSSGDFDDDF